MSDFNIFVAGALARAVISYHQTGPRNYGCCYYCCFSHLRHEQRAAPNAWLAACPNSFHNIRG